MNLKKSLAKVAEVPVARTAGIAEEMGCRGQFNVRSTAKVTVRKQK